MARFLGSARGRLLAVLDFEAALEGGGHFINHFGLFTTEGFERWRGQEPELPDFMRR